MRCLWHPHSGAGGLAWSWTHGRGAQAPKAIRACVATGTRQKCESDVPGVSSPPVSPLPNS